MCAQVTQQNKQSKACHSEKEFSSDVILCIGIDRRQVPSHHPHTAPLLLNFVLLSLYLNQFEFLSLKQRGLICSVTPPYEVGSKTQNK